MNPMIILKESIFLLDKNEIESLINKNKSSKIIYNKESRYKDFYLLKSNLEKNFINLMKKDLLNKLEKKEESINEILKPKYFFNYPKSDIFLFKDKTKIKDFNIELELQINSFAFCIDKIKYSKYNNFSAINIYNKSINSNIKKRKK